MNEPAIKAVLAATRSGRPLTWQERRLILDALAVSGEALRPLGASGPAGTRSLTSAPLPPDHKQEGVEATEGQGKSRHRDLEPSSPPDPIREEMARALEKIIATPSMPFPDPGAHSWRAWGSAVYSAWQQIQFTARTALSLHRGK